MQFYLSIFYVHARLLFSTLLSHSIAIMIARSSKTVSHFLLKSGGSRKICLISFAFSIFPLLLCFTFWHIASPWSPRDFGFDPFWFSGSYLWKQQGTKVSTMLFFRFLTTIFLNLHIAEEVSSEYHFFSLIFLVFKPRF